MNRTTLHHGWTVRAVSGNAPTFLEGVAVPATVPGCIHLDLLAAGLIPDPHLDENERLLSWIGRVDWRYETTFPWSGDGESADLVALGLDTVATVELNGTLVGHTRNMHRTHRFPVGHLLREGTNTLAVTFTGALTAAEQAAAELGPRPHVNRHPFNAVRKMACDYGWDWGPETLTAGIWRPIHLESWPVAGIAAVRPLASADGLVRTHVDVRRRDGRSLRLTVTVGGIEAAGVLEDGDASAVVEVHVPDPELWWPRGHGEQPLYDVAVRLHDGGDVVDEWHGRIGFRTVELDTTPDRDGTPFTLRVNGRPIFARGVNWIPADCFPARVTRDHYAGLLAQACDANANLVRVWGGGLYESDDFYDVCDETGLLVWQDFLFACAAYAEEEPLYSEVEAEAREAVTRLSPHPSLVLWNGGNENIWGYHDWGWQAQLQGRTWGWGYYTELLPAVVAELDPTRPYLTGSPFSLDPIRHPNEPGHGPSHIWDVWNTVDHLEYRRHAPRFVAEFGFQGPPTWATLTRAVSDRPLRPNAPGILQHQKAEDGNGKLSRGLAVHLPPPTTTEDWHWATSLNQARAVALGVEHFRSLMPLCMGAVVWQLNDVWPVISWSAVDGDGRRKPLWYALRRSFRDRLLTIQPRDGALAVVAVNDSGDPWQEGLTISRLDFEGDVLATYSADVDLTPRGSSTIPLPADLVTPGDPARQLLVAQTGPNRAYWHFAEDIATKLPPPHLVTKVEPTGAGYRLTVRAETFVRDLTVLADRVAADAYADDSLVTLLPGETVTFDIRTAADVALEAFVDPLVLRSANQLVADTLDTEGGSR
ncbi:MAG: glycoside hydrolase family 2 protein [Hamadaea sp.]|nr:glycoside hydrolase family 2 protein [Hamadaea sp.]